MAWLARVVDLGVWYLAENNVDLLLGFEAVLVMLANRNGPLPDFGKVKSLAAIGRIGGKLVANGRLKPPDLRVRLPQAHDCQDKLAKGAVCVSNP